jgi:hypothetical protein
MRHTLFVLIAAAGLSGCVSSSHEDWPRRCPVHQKALRGDTVEVAYGLPSEFRIPEWREARQNQFPYANTYEWGGCCPDHGEKLARTKYCSDCRHEYARWQKESFPAIAAKYFPGAADE